MHVRFMQKVDYYAGIPLCFIFTCIDKIKRFLTKQLQVDINKILFIELSEMGSAIIAYSSLKKAAQKHGKDKVYFLIFSSNKESVEILGIIPAQNIITINSSNFISFVFSLLGAIFKLRKHNFSACLDLELFSRCTALLSYLSGAKIRAGFYNYTEEGLYRGNLFSHRVYYNAGLHMSENFMALLDSVYEKTSDLPLLKKKIFIGSELVPHYTPDLETIQKAESLLSQLKFKKGVNKLYILNPDPGLLTLRGWPQENYAALAKLLIDKDKVNIVAIAGLKQSKKYYDFINSACNSERLVDLTGKTANLKELLALFTYAECLITNDSGPAHMSGLTNTKTIVLFGPETPLRYRPLGEKSISLFAGIACSPCYSASNHRHSICTNNICMQEISVQEVFEKI